jgi:hypothetical protein
MYKYYSLRSTDKEDSMVPSVYRENSEGSLEFYDPYENYWGRSRFTNIEDLVRISSVISVIITKEEANAYIMLQELGK